MTNLNQIAVKSLSDIIKMLDDRINTIPKNQECKYSAYPEKIWCTKLNKMAMYSICEQCPSYDLKYQTKN